MHEHRRAPLNEAASESAPKPVGGARHEHVAPGHIRGFAHYAHRIDYRIVDALNDLAIRHDAAFEDPLRFLAVDAQYMFVVLLAVLFVTTGKWRSVNGRHGVVAAGLSALLALGIAHLFAGVWPRPRPYIAHPDLHLFIAPSNDSSFPSDHATAAFAIAVALLLRHRMAGLVALVLATLLAFARVVVGTHYPSDVAAGAAIGAAAALMMWHPSVRRPLQRLADWAGRIYDSGCRRLTAGIGSGQMP